MPETLPMGKGKKLQAWLALHLVPGLGPITCFKLLNHFGGPEEVLAAPIPELTRVCRLRPESRSALADTAKIKLMVRAAAEIERAWQENITVISCDDSLYPSQLRNIHDPPLVLFIRGNPEILCGHGIGMVGSRSATHYGRDISQKMANSLARHGFTVISGMALGIDTAAHQGALAANGRTIAVLGCGLDIIYPPSNHKLYDEICTTGAVISEYPFGTRPEHFRFPARNRIISGLSLGVVVVEAANRSGSLITAGHALEQGREVFAVPGRIDSAKSAGTHYLLQQGAKLVQSMNDIVDELSHIPVNTGRLLLDNDDSSRGCRPRLSKEEAKLLTCLDVYPQTIEELVSVSGFTVQKTNELLLLLELKGHVDSLPGKTYQKNSTVSV